MSRVGHAIAVLSIALTFGSTSLPSITLADARPPSARTPRRTRPRRTIRPPPVDASRRPRSSSSRGRIRAASGFERAPLTSRTRAHLRDVPNRPGPWGVFEGGEEAVFALIDEGLERAEAEGPEVTTQRKGPRGVVHFIDMGRRIGFVGGRIGKEKGNPAAKILRLELEGDQLVNAYPLLESPARNTSGERALTSPRGPIEPPAFEPQAPPLPRDHPSRAAFRRLSDRRFQTAAGLVYLPNTEDTAPSIPLGPSEPLVADHSGGFDGDLYNVLALIDEAFHRATARQDSRTPAERIQEGQTQEFLIDMGRPIGRDARGRRAEYVRLELGPGRRVVAVTPIRRAGRERTARSVARTSRQEGAPHADEEPPGTRVGDALAAIGMPTEANREDPNDYLVVHAAARFVASYNSQLMVPNWTVHVLTAKDIANTPRAGDFREPTLLPNWMPRALPSALRGMPYHRGHFVSRSDRSSRPEEAIATFLMGVNAAPVLGEVNVGPWSSGEREVRRHTSELGMRAAIFQGPIWQHEIFRASGIAVPSALWKLQVLIDADMTWQDLARSHVMGMIVPNTPHQLRVDQTWAEFQAPLSEIIRLADMPTAFRGLIQATDGRALTLEGQYRPEAEVQQGEHALEFKALRWMPGRSLWSHSAPEPR